MSKRRLTYFETLELWTSMSERKWKEATISFKSASVHPRIRRRWAMGKGKLSSHLEEDRVKLWHKASSAEFYRERVGVRKGGPGVINALNYNIYANYKNILFRSAFSVGKPHSQLIIISFCCQAADCSKKTIFERDAFTTQLLIWTTT